ncbi:hypothetical protein ACVQHX_22850, partial [Klebsiella pneumoniae]
LLCHGTVCVVGKMRDLILQLSKSSIYSTKPFLLSDCGYLAGNGTTGCTLKQAASGLLRIEVG